VATNQIDKNRWSSFIGEQLLMFSSFLWALLLYGWSYNRKGRGGRGGFF